MITDWKPGRAPSLAPPPIPRQTSSHSHPCKPLKQKDVWTTNDNISGGLHSCELRFEKDKKELEPHHMLQLRLLDQPIACRDCSSAPTM